MKSQLVSWVVLITGFLINGLGGPVFAASGIKIFDATPSFGTGTSQATATPFNSTSLILEFVPGDTAVISSTSDGTGAIVVDNFLAINGINVCEAEPEQSCFGSLIDPGVPTGVPIETVRELIPPLDVSSFIPIGTSSVLFEFRDFGVIAGNTDLFLVTTATVIPAPRPPIGPVLDTLIRELQSQLQAVEDTLQRSLVRVENTTQRSANKVESTLQRGLVRVENVTQRVGKQVTATRAAVEVVDKSLGLQRRQVSAIVENVEQTENIARRTLKLVD